MTTLGRGTPRSESGSECSTQNTRYSAACQLPQNPFCIPGGRPTHPMLSLQGGESLQTCRCCFARRFTFSRLQVGYFHMYKDGVDYVFVEHGTFHGKNNAPYSGSRLDIAFRCVSSPHYRGTALSNFVHLEASAIDSGALTLGRLFYFFRK